MANRIVTILLLIGALVPGLGTADGKPRPATATPMPPPDAYLRAVDRAFARAGRYDRTCETADGFGTLPVDQCFKMRPAARLSGVWLDELEGSRFFLGQSRVPPESARPAAWEKVQGAWLKIDRRQLPRGLQSAPTGGAFAMEFIGRRTQFRGAYGRFGMFETWIIVDRVLSIRRLKTG